MTIAKNSQSTTVPEELDSPQIFLKGVNWAIESGEIRSTPVSFSERIRRSRGGEGITPATLPVLGLLDQLRADGNLRQGSNGAKFTVVGYGGILAWPPPRVTYEDQRRFAVSEYRALLPAWLRMSQNHATGDGGTCYGDSGGPAFWEPESETRILVGITSWGDAPCVATGFNYRTDIPQTLNFIKDVIDNLPS